MRTLCVFAALLAAAPQSSADIFKCRARNGLPLYQNFPCDVDSPGFLPSQPAAGAPAAKPKSIQAGFDNQVKTTGASSPPGTSELRVGMTAQEVRTLWGEPAEVLQDEPRSGRVEIWQYADGRVVQINVKQRVISIQR
jgi:hypothetical protein